MIYDIPPGGIPVYLCEYDYDYILYYLSYAPMMPPVQGIAINIFLTLINDLNLYEVLVNSRPTSMSI